MKINIQSYLSKITYYLKNRGIESSNFEARYVMSQILGLKPYEFALNNVYRFSIIKLLRLIWAIRKRVKGFPISYCVGYKYIYGEKFVVKGVFIPRYETEVLIDYIIKLKPKRVLDIGTGSGIIAILVKKYLPETIVVATDISKNAIKIAGLNAKRILKGSGNIKFINADLFPGEEYYGFFDVVVSNPPYVESSFIDANKELAKEPRIALDGGSDGLFYYKKIAKQAGNYLMKGGKLVVEIGRGQDNDVINIYKESRFKNVYTIKDLNNINRVVIGEI